MYLGLYQTMKLSFEQICQGEHPWVALGNFRNDWYAYHADERERLVIDPLPEGFPPEYSNWAAFCAASVRWFCATYEIACPSWVESTQYRLSEPWYLNNPSNLWQYLRETTFEEFVQHNIFCGNRVYINKYELDEQRRPFKKHPLNLEERQALVRAAAERARQEEADLQRRIQDDPHIQEILARRALARKNKYTTHV